MLSTFVQHICSDAKVAVVIRRNAPEFQNGGLDPKLRVTLGG